MYHYAYKKGISWLWNTIENVKYIWRQMLINSIILPKLFSYFNYSNVRMKVLKNHFTCLNENTVKPLWALSNSGHLYLEKTFQSPKHLCTCMLSLLNSRQISGLWRSTVQVCIPDCYSFYCISLTTSTKLFNLSCHTGKVNILTVLIFGTLSSLWRKVIH